MNTDGYTGVADHGVGEVPPAAAVYSSLSWLLVAVLTAIAVLAVGGILTGGIGLAAAAGIGAIAAIVAARSIRKWSSRGDASR